MEIKRIIGGILMANCYIISPSGASPQSEKNNESEPGAKAYAKASRPAESAAAKKPCYIIDPGYDPRKIIKYITGEGLAPEAIILTHHHTDHSGAAALLRKELDCPIMIHRNDADRFRAGADILLEDGDVLRLPGNAFIRSDASGNGGAKGESEDGTGRDSLKLTVLHTPGHTRGGICLMAEREHVCFTGDTIFNVDLGRTDLDDGSYEEMVSSILNVVDKWGNDITIYPGHGDPETMKKVRIRNLEFLEIVENNQKS